MADTIRETLLEARAALRRRADDESTPMREGRILREAALLADMHAAALDPKANKAGVACLLQGIAHPRDAAVMALLLADLHEQTASAPGQPPQIADGVRQRAAVWRALADQFPRAADEGVSSVILWAYMARVNLGIISLIQVAPAPQQMMFIREVNMLATENVALSMLQEDAAAQDAADIETTPSTPNEAHAGLADVMLQERRAGDLRAPADGTDETTPTTPSLFVVVGG